MRFVDSLNNQYDENITYFKQCSVSVFVTPSQVETEAKFYY